LGHPYSSVRRATSNDGSATRRLNGNDSATVRDSAEVSDKRRRRGPPGYDFVAVVFGPNEQRRKHFSGLDLLCQLLEGQIRHTSPFLQFAGISKVLQTLVTCAVI